MLVKISVVILSKQGTFHKGLTGGQSMIKYEKYTGLS